jgi:hypothetical protein
MLYNEKQIFLVDNDKATGYNGPGHLIAYMRYVEDTTMNEDVPFC